MKQLSVCMLMMGLCLSMALPGFSMGDLPPFDHELVARAEVDECFNGIGEPYVSGPDCEWYEKPKANQSYLWGLTRADDTLWFGTAANMLCLVRAFSSYSADGGGGLGELLSSVSPYQNDLWLCEYDEGLYPETEMITTVPDVFSDYRPPQIYTYDIQTRALTNMTDTMATVDDQIRLESTFGLRSAVTFDNLVFLSGPVALGEGINMFVFDANTREFVSSDTFMDYQNIRKWLVLDGVLYAAVANEEGGGRVLRWTGSRTNPLSFVEVGKLDGGGAEIAAHQGRIFVGTWPGKGENPSLAGIWMSPLVPQGGLTENDYNSWEKVWETDEYEPDPLNASIYGIGAMASFDGHLYWGTMHVHGKAAVVFIDQYDMGISQFIQTYFNSWRAAALFRGSDFSGDRDVELLYGNSSMPVYVEGGLFGGYWTYRQNNMGGISGKYGSAGFGNVYNNYIWTMAVYADQLFIGTMDHSYLWLDWDHLQRYYFGGEWFHIPVPQIPWFYTPSQEEYGADLWRIPSASDKAERVSRDGLGNYTNYGFRSVAVDDSGLYIGTANPASVNTDAYGNIDGGWELIRVFER